MDLPVIVIGNKNQSRNKLFASEEWANTKLSYVEPFFFPMDPRSYRYQSTNLSTLQLGREISNREIGCAIAHRLAIEKSFQMIEQQNNQEWSLILEDDADINEQKLEEIKKCLDNNRLDSPAIISFHSDPQRDAQNMTPKLSGKDIPPKLKRQIFFLRSVAACYAVNKSALAYLEGFKFSPVDYVADWPPYFAKINFYLSRYPRVSEVVAESTIGLRESQSIPKRIGLHVRQLLRLQTIAEFNRISKWQTFRVLIFSPIVRDLHGLLYKTVKRR
jgi:GR25 family glycosyltransferase involved in LPS biosynthesis